MDKKSAERIRKSGMTILIIDEKKYMERLSYILAHVNDSIHKPCYVCLSRPYTHVVEDLEKLGIDTKKFFFVDTMSSHYAIPEPSENCAFLIKPYDLSGIKDIIMDAVKERGCSVLIFDNIGSLLAYHNRLPITQFINSMSLEDFGIPIKKMYVMEKNMLDLGGDDKEFVEDVSLLADVTLVWNEHLSFL